MRISWRQVPDLLRSASGRLRLRQGVFGHASGILLPLAGAYRRSLGQRIHITAVTGSYGKTTTTRAIANVLGRPLEAYEGWNAGSFLAAALLKTSPRTANTVLEVGISRPGTMRRYARIVRPDAVVVTSIGTSHHGSFHTLETTRQEKCDLVRGIRPGGAAILNADDPHVLWMATQTRASVSTYGFSPDAEVRARHPMIDRSGTRFAVTIEGETLEVESRLFGRPSIYAALAAIAVAKVRGIPASYAIAALADLPAAPGRLQPIRLSGGALLLDDGSKSDIETIDAGLDVLAKIPAGRRIAVLGEITEPMLPQGPHYVRMGERAAAVADQLIVVGGRKSFKSVRSGARKAGMRDPAIQHAYPGPDEAVDILHGRIKAEDVVLIKGRRIQHLERISHALSGVDVACSLRACRLPISCGDCPMLAREE